MRVSLLILSVFLFQLSVAVWNYQPSTNVTDYLNGLVNNSDYQSYVGYINVTDSGSNIFYQLVTAKNSDPTDYTKPLLVWLQGGPGCSSLFGLYTEIGPFSLGSDGKLTINNNTYALDNHILFVEQPIGVGFSTANSNDVIPTHTTEAAKHFETFLMNFFQVYTSLALNDLYLIGESYAGHYIPSFARQIISNQTNNKLPTLDGVLIGDGWTDPERQLMGYDSYAYSIGLIGTARRNLYKNVQNTILQDIINGIYYNASGMFDFITGTDPQFNESIPNVAGNVNIYNYRQYNTDSFDPLTKWVNTDSVKQNFNITPSTFQWQSCNDTMYYSFYDDIARSYKKDVQYLLENTTARVLLYNGQNDIIVNTPSAENWIHSIDWPKSDQFLATPKQFWKINGNIVGTVKQLNPLTFAFISNAGHMVPTDQPVPALNMVRRWLNNQTDWTN